VFPSILFILYYLPNNVKPKGCFHGELSPTAVFRSSSRRSVYRLLCAV